MLSFRTFGRRKVCALLLLAGLSCVGIYGWKELRRRETERWLKEAIVFSKSNRAAQAIPLLDRVLERNPAEAEALLYRAVFASEAGQRDLTRTLLARVTDNSPQQAGVARFLEGAMALEDNRAREAETLYRKSIALHPTYRQPREGLVQIYANQLRGSELRAVLDELSMLRSLTVDELIVYTEAMGPSHPVGQELSQMEAWFRADPEDFESLLALCRYYLIDNRAAQAVRLLEQAITDHPADPRCAALLSEACVQVSNPVRALQVLQSFPVAANSHPWLWRSLGMASLANGDWQRAAECLEHALRDNPEDIPVAYKLGQAWERLGRHKAAERLLQQTRLMEILAISMFRLRSFDKSRTDLMVLGIVESCETALKLGRCREAADWSALALSWSPSDPTLLRLSKSARAALATDGPWPGDVRLLLAEFAGSVGGERFKPPTRAPRNRPVAETVPSSPAATVRLVDCHAEAGIDFEYFTGHTKFKFLVETLGGGVAILDYDGDGWPDLYFTQGSTFPLNAARNAYPDRLYRNLGDGTFHDVTALAGLGDRHYSQGCAVGDYDNDGDPDLVVANYGTNVFYVNNGDGTFTDATRRVGLAGTHWASSLALADLDRDGNLDLYVVNYVLDPLKICPTQTGAPLTCSPDNFVGEDDVLYRSAGDGTFVDVSAAAGILAPEGKGLGIVVADLDDDNWPDIFVANDGTPNFLFRNLGADGKGGLRFDEIGMTAGCAVNAEGVAQAGMGIACGDLDNDGRLDLFVTHFFREYATLYLNQGSLLFEDATRAANLVEPTRSMLGFGTQAIDFDLDGQLDLIIANGHIDDFRFRGEPWKMPPQLFRNRGGLRFDDGGSVAGEYFQGSYLGRGLARLDFNRDGRPDVAIVHQDRPVALLRNETVSAGNAVVLQLHGVVSNRDALGARITWQCGADTHIAELTGGDGFFASNERKLTLGLGTASQVDRLSIRWPSGKTDDWIDLPAGADVTLIEGRPPILRRISRVERAGRQEEGLQQPRPVL